MSAVAAREALAALQCPYCRRAPLQARASAIHCLGCERDFPMRAGVIDTLVEPDPEVVRELEGMMREREECGEHYASIEEYKVAHVPAVQTHAQREEWNADEPTQYFLSTRLNLEQAMGKLEARGGRRVLEIGAQNRFETLQQLRRLGYEEAFAVNIHFLYSDDAPLGGWPTALLADMNRLPFRDGYFDLVLACATTHHSPDLDRTLGEVARVLAPGGQAILINDPTNGPLKHLWEKIGRLWGWHRELRNDLIHENEYTAREYRRLFRRHGLHLRHSMFSAYYDQRLQCGGFAGVRWAAIATVVSWCWRLPGMAALLKRFALRPGQALLGLELNVIAEKVPVTER